MRTHVVVRSKNIFSVARTDYLIYLDRTYYLVSTQERYVEAVSESLLLAEQRVTHFCSFFYSSFKSLFLSLSESVVKPELEPVFMAILSMVRQISWSYKNQNIFASSSLYYHSMRWFGIFLWQLEGSFGSYFLRLIFDPCQWHKPGSSSELSDKYASPLELKSAIDELLTIFTDPKMVVTNPTALKEYGSSENSYHPTAAHAVAASI